MDDTKTKPASSGSTDWDDEGREYLTPKWEIPVIFAVVAGISAWRTFYEGFTELPIWLRETFAHVVAFCIMGIMVFPEIRWWFVAVFAMPCILSVFAAGLTGMMEAVDPSDAEDWFGKDSEFWNRRAFFFVTMSAVVAPLAYLR